MGLDRKNNTLGLGRKTRTLGLHTKNTTMGLDRKTAPCALTESPELWALTERPAFWAFTKEKHSGPSQKKSTLALHRKNSTLRLHKKNRVQQNSLRHIPQRGKPTQGKKKLGGSSTYRIKSYPPKNAERAWTRKECICEGPECLKKKKIFCIILILPILLLN